MKRIPPPTSLHVLPLPHPHILLPGNRLALPVSKETFHELIAMMETYEEKEEEEGYVPPQTQRRTVGKNRKSFLVAAVPIVPGTETPSSTASTKTDTPAPGLEGGGYLPPIQPEPHSNPNPASDANPHFSEWGVTARILRLIKPSSSNRIETTDGHGPLAMVRGTGTPPASYVVFLQGLSRVRLLEPSKITPSLSSTVLPLFSVSHTSSPAPGLEQLDPEALIKFKQSALIFLDRLARDSVKRDEREARIKIAEMLDDPDLHSSSPESLSRAAWIVDVLVGKINDYNDKLGKLL